MSKYFSKFLLASGIIFIIFLAFFANAGQVRAISVSNYIQIHQLQLEIKILKAKLDQLIREQELQKPTVFYDAVADTEAENARLLPLSASPAVTITPVISSLNPEIVTNGSIVTIKGQGFSPTGNRIMLTYGLVDNVPSSDGQTLTFTMNLFNDVFNSIKSNPQAWQKAPETVNIPVFVQNASGLSNIVTFKLRLKP